MYLVWSRDGIFLLWPASIQSLGGHSDNHMDAVCWMVPLWNDHRNCHLLWRKTRPPAEFAWAGFETRCCFSSFLLLANVPHGAARPLHPRPGAAHLPPPFHQLGAGGRYGVRPCFAPVSIPGTAALLLPSSEIRNRFTLLRVSNRNFRQSAGISLTSLASNLPYPNLHIAIIKSDDGFVTMCSLLEGLYLALNNYCVILINFFFMIQFLHRFGS